MLLTGGSYATNTLIILWSRLPAWIALKYSSVRHCQTLPNFLKRCVVVKFRSSGNAHSHSWQTSAVNCQPKMLSETAFRKLTTLSLPSSLWGFFPPQVWQNYIPDCLWSRTYKTEEGSRKTREEERKDAAGVNSCESFSGVEKRQRQKEWEAESNKNPETASWRRVAPFEYRAAAAGVCVEQLCTSHSITIRRARCC